MPLNLTEEQILRLAPDEASVKAGKGLATPGKWILRECSDRCIWGLCQGSGKNPYQTAIDLNDIAFKCSCPSRKFPCKHGLGLLLLYARQPDLFQQAEESEWVKTWLAKRTEKAEKKEQKAKSEKPVDEAAQAKRQEKRHQNVLNGISDLETWMKDILRNGLLNLPERAYTLFDNMARRMIDAQAPGLATRLKEIQEIDFSSENWRSELTDKLGKLYLLIRAYRNLERLSDEWRDEIRSQVGYTQPKETVLANEPVADSWLVLHKRSQKINDINTDIYWFYAYWFEGFLHASGSVLLLNDNLWLLVNSWICGLQEESFRELLPILRRTFSDFSSAERRKLGEKAKRFETNGDSIRHAQDETMDDQEAAKVIPLLSNLLGIE